jgi:hypothetical protein
MKKPIYKTGYFYLHVNGQLIWKPNIVVESDPQYFNSPLVVRYWKIENEYDFKEMIIEAQKINNGV